ncbi:AraC family transcriptional regulator [Litoribacillus peritrichatus]|uniref:AraC family transcriptional regulator n=1 Tax=Litoribacillus peritrichatus TaxID=718191 RepID=A0ABP7MUT2_9GAMM
MAEYQDRFVTVINYIEANLNTDLDTETLCQQAHLSKYHFHRQCSAFFGMPLMSLVKLLRLKRAAYQLAYRADKKVIDVALANGYESHEAFSRAFKKHFLKSPSDFRMSPDWRPWQKYYEPIETLRNTVMDKTAQFNVTLVDFPETFIAVMEHRGAPHLLGNTIQKFIAWRKEHQLPPSQHKTFNLVYDDPTVTSSEDFRFDLACSIARPMDDTIDKRNEKRSEKNVGGVVNKTIPAGKCAVIRHVGSDDTIGVAVNYLYTQWLNDSGFELRDFPVFFERVSFFPDVPEHKMVTDVFLPIE